MTYQKLLASAAGAAVAVMIALPAVGAQRTVVGEYFTARW